MVTENFTRARFYRSRSGSAITGSLAALALGFILAFESSARADDWLALYGECGFGPHATSPGGLALLYPRTGLAAVVPAGSRLVTRVRVPTALTPPPGRQQDRALVGWAAELLGHGVTTDLGPVDHRYRVRVADVRPDGPSVPVYRATIHIPAWAAPGTYTLRVWAPGGQVSEVAAVRIHERGSPPRVAVARPPEANTIDWLRRLVHAPVDVTLVAPSPELRRSLSHGEGGELPALVLVGLSNRAVALRLDSQQLWVTGGCSGARWSKRFRRVATGEELTVRRELEFPSSSGAVSLRGEPVSLPDVDPRSGFPLRSDHAAELTFVVPLGFRPVRFEGAEHTRVYPSTALGPGSRVGVAVRAFLQPPAAIEFRTGASEPFAAAINITPNPVPAGAVARLELSGTASERVAWALAEDVTATGSRVSNQWAAPEEHRVVAMVMRSDARATMVQADVRVVPRLGEFAGCSTEGSGSRGFLWILAVLLIQIRLVRCGKRRGRISCSVDGFPL